MIYLHQGVPSRAVRLLDHMVARLDESEWLGMREGKELALQARMCLGMVQLGTQGRVNDGYVSLGGG